MDQVGTDTSLVLTIKLIQDSVRQLHLIPVPTPIRRHSRLSYILSRYSTQPGQQYATKDDDNPLILPKETKYIQSVVGSFLYYARAIDSTMLPALAQIAQ